MNTVYDFLEMNKDLPKDAVICGIDKLTYRSLYEKTRILGSKLANEDSENIILYMPNSIYYVISFFAVLSCGKAVYPISSLSKPDEVVSALDNTKSSVVLCVEDKCDLIKDVLEERNCKYICVDDSALYDEKDFDFEQPFNSNPERNYSVLLNTSGSTGIHKIVMLSQEGIITNSSDWIEAALNPEEPAKILLSMPAATSFGTITMTTCIRLGWTIEFLPSFFSTGNLLNLIRKEKITHLLTIGSMLNMLAMDVANLPSSSEFDSLQFIGIGGNKAAPESMKTLLKFFKNAGISPGYGITEATCIVTAIHPDVSKNEPELFYEKINATGIPFGHSKIRLSKIEGMDDGVGEVLISGPAVMRGYYNNAKATEETLIDGELHTGDIGYFDEDGYLYLTGRIKNIIKSGGYTVFPEEVEAVLDDMSQVKAAYVYGVPDPIIDERITVDIVLDDGVKIEEDEILEYCREHLADYKIPREVKFVSNIERTKTGKIKRGAHKASE